MTLAGTGVMAVAVATAVEVAVVVAVEVIAVGLVVLASEAIVGAGHLIDSF